MIKIDITQLKAIHKNFKFMVTNDKNTNYAEVWYDDNGYRFFIYKKRASDDRFIKKEYWRSVKNTMMDRIYNELLDINNCKNPNQDYERTYL